MRARFGIPLTLVGFIVYTGVMITLNNHIGVYDPVSASNQEVAGVSVQKNQEFALPNNSSLTFEINSARKGSGLPSLVEDSRLNKLAQIRAQDMVTQGYYAHKSPQQLTFVNYLPDVGLSDKTYSCENLLMTQSKDPINAVNEWLNSPSHAACMKDKIVTRIGVYSLDFDQNTGQKLFVAIFAESN
jgi:uncharacterized protein YkwD